MSAPDWIPLAVDPDGPEIVRIASATCPQNVPDPSHVAIVFACVVRWFRYVDRYFTGPETGLLEHNIHQIVRWPCEKSLVEAMCDPVIAWLQPSVDQTLTVVDFEKWFGRCAKRRLLDARRKKVRRDADKCPQNVRSTTTTTTTEDIPPIPPSKKPVTKTKFDPWETARTAMKSDALNTDAFRAAWAEWVADRAARGRRLTKRAIQLQVGKLEAFGHGGAIESIHNAIDGGWATFYPPRDGRSGPTGTSAQTRPQAPPGKYDGIVGATGSALDQVGGHDAG